MDVLVKRVERLYVTEPGMPSYIGVSGWVMVVKSLLKSPFYLVEHFKIVHGDIPDMFANAIPNL